MSEVKNSILAGIAFGVLFGFYISIRYGIDYAIVLGPISGLVLGISIYFFVTSKIVKQQTQITTADSETIVCSGGANHFFNGEAVGGKLYLLIDKLQFQSHSFNLQNHGLVIDIKNIQRIDFYNTLGLIPNGLSITTFDGRTERFVVSGRQNWKNEIEKLQHQNSN